MGPQSAQLQLLAIFIVVGTLATLSCNKSTDKPNSVQGIDSVNTGNSNDKDTDDLVYFGAYSGVVYALHAGDGSLAWSKPLGSPDAFFAAPNIHNGILYIGGGDHVLHAADAYTGEAKWSFTANDIFFSAPVISGNTVFISNQDKNLYAINALTGEKRWAFPEYFIYGSPAVDHGVVYSFDWNGTFYAIDSASGTQKWQSVLGPDEAYSSVKLYNGLIYVAVDGIVYALNPDGSQYWSGKVYEDTKYGGPTPGAGMVFTGGMSDTLFALDAKTGARTWSFAASPLTYIQSSPTVSDGVVYFGSQDHYVYALDAATGSMKWRFDTGSDIESSPTISNGTVYVTALLEKCFALDATTGKQKWVYTLPEVTNLYGPATVLTRKGKTALAGIVGDVAK